MRPMVNLGLKFNPPFFTLEQIKSQKKFLLAFY